MKAKVFLLSFLILISLVILTIWLNQNNFFLSWNNSDFNNLLTPVIALISIVLLIFTLTDSQTFNKRQLAINEYNILLQDFELVKSNIENLTFNIKTKGFSESFQRDLENSNGTNYIALVSQFLSFEITQKNDNDKNEELISRFRFDVIFPLIRNYRNLIIFLNEVMGNDILIERYKKKFYLKSEHLLLQNYFRLCNNIDMSGKPQYDLEVFDSYAYKLHEFTELNDFFIKHDLFQLNDLEFYKKTT